VGEEGIPLFSEEDWPQERIRLFIESTVLRSDIHEAANTASEGVTIPDDMVESDNT